MATPTALTEADAEERQAPHLKFFPLEGRPSLLLTEHGCAFPPSTPPTARLLAASSRYGFIVVGHQGGARYAVPHPNLPLTLPGLAFIQANPLLNDVDAVPAVKLIGLRGEPVLLSLSPDDLTLAVRSQLTFAAATHHVDLRWS